MKFFGMFAQQMRDRREYRHNAVPQAVESATHFADDLSTFGIASPQQGADGVRPKVAT